MSKQVSDPLVYLLNEEGLNFVYAINGHLNRNIPMQDYLLLQEFPVSPEVAARCIETGKVSILCIYSAATPPITVVGSEIDVSATLLQGARIHAEKTGNVVDKLSESENLTRALAERIRVDRYSRVSKEPGDITLALNNSYFGTHTDVAHVTSFLLAEWSKLQDVSRETNDPESPPVPKGLSVPELNADLIEILGRPNFNCGGVANMLRLKGVDVPFKAEAEQAHCIHYYLKCYEEDPVNWRDLIAPNMLRGTNLNTDRMGFRNVAHIGDACSLISVVVEPSKNNPKPFEIKGIFPRPYNLKEGIFFEDPADPARYIMQVFQAGKIFDRSLAPEKFLTYDQYLELVDKAPE